MSKGPNGTLLECLDCGKKFIFPIKKADGRRCPECGGQMLPRTNVYYGMDLAHKKDRTSS